MLWRSVPEDACAYLTFLERARPALPRDVVDHVLEYSGVPTLGGFLRLSDARISLIHEVCFACARVTNCEHQPDPSVRRTPHFPADL